MDKLWHLNSNLKFNFSINANKSENQEGDKGNVFPGVRHGE